MSVALRILGVAVGLAILTGCQEANDSLWSDQSGGQAAGDTTQSASDSSGSDSPLISSSNNQLVVTPASTMQANEQPVIDPSQYGNTGTVVSKKVRDIATELQDLEKAINQNRAAYKSKLKSAEQNAQNYYATVAAITARLQIGTTPGNPILQSQYNVAQSQLAQVADDATSFNTLGSAISSNASTSAYLSDSIDGALRLSGAVEEDHDQLSDLQELNRRAEISIEHAMSELNAVVERQNNYVNTERTRMSQLAQAISTGRIYGPALADLGTQQAPANLTGAAALNGRDPLVVIRFDRDNVDYQQPLYKAVSAALERKPDAVFDLVAVSPASDNSGDVAIASTKVKRDAEDVLRSLTEMGLPSDRVTLSATTSNDTQANEVRIYVR